MSALSAIPLPLRIVGILLLGVMAFNVFGKVAGSFIALVAVLLWLIVIITLFYEFGWLNFLAKVPLLSSFLGMLSNRKQVTEPDNLIVSEAPRGVLDDKEREELYDSAQLELNALLGISDAKRDIDQKLVSPAQANPDNPFGTQSPALVVLFHGPRGNGKTTAALCTARSFVGLNVLESAKVITIKSTDLRGGQYGTATQLGLKKAEEAVDGTLLIDDADWLLADSPYGDDAGPGVDLGLALLEVAQRFPRRIFIALTMSTRAADRLKQDGEHARWLGKLTVRDIAFDNLDTDSLLSVLSGKLSAMGWRLEDAATENAVGRLLNELQDRRQEQFDNAEACRRVAERLVEISTDEQDELAANRIVSRASVRLLDDQLE